MASEIPRIDFSGLYVSGECRRSDGAWAAVRARLMELLEVFGTFEVEYDRFPVSVRDEFFGKAVEDLFSLPPETKSRDASRTILGGHVDDAGNFEFESHFVDNSDTPAGVDRFAEIFWPDGNLAFSDTTLPFTKGMAELQSMIMRMIFEGYGMTEESQDALLGSSSCGLRMSRYLGESAGIRTHTDSNFINIICQHTVPGLEVELRDGRRVAPPPGACVVVIGDMMEMVTNGRLKPTVHSVRMPKEGEATERSKRSRYSAIMGPKLPAGAIVETPSEMVDADNPLLFNPVKWDEYMAFKYSDSSADLVRRGALKDFCGVFVVPGSR